jgi:hypothetical protein
MEAGMDDPIACEVKTRMRVTPTGLELMRFDYAWKWFDFHAEQRTKMFNYMLIGMGIFATALVTAIDKRLLLEAAVLSTAAAVVALVFCLIDRRNRELYIAAMDVLIDAEKTVVFGETTFKDRHGQEQAFGISRRIAVDDGPKAEKLLDHRHGIAKGQHRYWMPFIALGFMALFAVAAIRAWLIYFESVPKWPVTAIGVLAVLVGLEGLVGKKHHPAWYACFMFGVLTIAVAQLVPALSRPLAAQGNIDVVVGGELNSMLDLRFKQSLDAARGTELGLLASERFGPFESGSDSLDCSGSGLTQATTNIRTAVEDAQRRNQRTLLLLVGGIDRTALLPALQQRYGSDAGLARARVSAVEKCLSAPNGTPLPADVLRVVTGPAYTPASPGASNAARQGMADDRVVRVVVLGLQPK